MICERCGRPLSTGDDVAEIEIDLSLTERFDFVSCRNCTEKIVESFQGGGDQ